MISIKQLCHKYKTNLPTLLSAIWRLCLEPNILEGDQGYAEAYIKLSDVPLLDSYFNYHE